MKKLSREERDLHQSIENGEWRSIPNLEAEKKRFQKVAAHTLRSRGVVIEVHPDDAETLRKRAARKEVSFGGLISGIVHKYA